MHFDLRPWHAEIFVSAATNQQILVRCECPRRLDHYFEGSAAKDAPAEDAPAESLRRSADRPRPTAFVRSGPRLP